MGSQTGPRLPKVIFWSHFWLLLGAFGEHFWGHFSSDIRNGRAYVDFLVPFFRSRKKERTRGCPGGGHAIHPRQRMFREGRPSSLRLHFGLHFGAKTGLPGGGDMRSAHAGACFVRVGSRRFGSILGSILKSFWEPSSPLYSFVVAPVAKTGIILGGQISSAPLECQK